MTYEIESQVSINVKKIDTKLRKLGVRLVSIMVSCWLIVGSITIRLMLPAYLVKQAASFQWTKEAVADTERTSQRQREPKVTVSESAYQQRQYPRTGYSGQNQMSAQNSIRSVTNTLNEARYFVRSAADLAVR